jgi:hypothetical protein
MTSLRRAGACPPLGDSRSMPSRAGGLLLEADHVYAEIREVEEVAGLGR